MASKINDRLSSLPLDVCLEFLKYINHKSDLLALSSTNKRLQDLSLPKLYENVDLLLDGTKQSYLDALLDPSHPGLKFIRHLKFEFGRMEPEIDGGVESVRNFQFTRSRQILNVMPYKEGRKLVLVPNLEHTDKAELFVSKMIDVLPADQLRTFVSPSRWEMPGFLWLKLHERQTRIYNITIPNVPSKDDDQPLYVGMDVDLDESSEDESQADWEDIPEHELETSDTATYLARKPNIFTAEDVARDISVCSVSSVDTFRIVIGRVRKLETLRLMGKVQIPPDVFQPGAIQVNERVVRSSLEDLRLQTPSQHPTPLKRLLLAGLDLGELASNMRRFDFANLQSLTVLDCHRMLRFLDALTAPATLPRKLKHVTVQFGRDQDEEISTGGPTAPQGLINLLGKISGLESLEITSRGAATYSDIVPILPAHSKTLRVLRVTFGGPPGVHSSAGQIVEICKQCQNLEQLWMDFPAINISNRLWAEDSNDQDEPFLRSLEAARGLPKLKALNLGRFWQEPVQLAIGALQNKQIYTLELELGSVMGRIFRIWDRSVKDGRASVEVLASVYQESFMDVMPKEPAMFMRVTSTDLAGQIKTQAMKADLNQVLDLVPQSSMLNRKMLW
ncbi:uncharacterized protein KY384_005076 [Bacidia gigantensis]|uniref:uncharacterized protein n=1 Tax=Bacidia gigantensis TaxID=2732470 RepID=UPI001D04B89D|nr:uncharacterized protein KY384_005076 [Bacidia gigantensis]KAG8530573.1 hypothetical protein KY384_005076 [Bacidia gigantensis]